MVDKKLSEFSEVSTGGVSYFPILDNNTKNGKLSAAKAMRWSNCITEIPQDIKVELVSGGFTLKAGTIYYMPDGTAKQTNSDITKTTAVAGGAGFSVVCINEAGTGMRYRNLASCVSGAGATTTGGFAYNTTTNKVEFYDSSGTMTSDDSSLPIMILETDSSGKVKSIYKLFNGCGYIGHHAFILPGISFLIAAGINGDGTLASNNYTKSVLSIIELDATRTVLDLINATTAEKSQGWIDVDTYRSIRTDVGLAKQYVKDENNVYFVGSGGVINKAGRTLVARFVYDGTSVTQFNVEPVMAIAKNEDIDTLYKSKQDSETALTHDYVSECPLEIPQDINLTLSSGTLTLKAGSILTGPDGTQVTTTEDKTHTYTSSSGQRFIYYSLANNNLQSSWVSATGSGSSLPADGSTYTVFFNTTDSKLYNWSSGSSSWNVLNNSLPIAIVTISGGQISSVDKVFNGCGYIGTTFFLLPGFTGLAPNGKNPDGSYASYKITTTALAFYSNIESTASNKYLVRSQSGGIGRGDWTESETIASGGRTYVPSKNRVYTSNGNEQSCFRFCKYETSNGVVTTFEQIPVIKLPSQDSFYSLKKQVDSLDEEVVKKSGNQTINGDLTFSGENTFTGTNTVPTQTAGDSSGLVANTEFVQRAIAANGATPRDVTTLWSNPSGSGSGTMNLSEPFTNFEKIGVYFAKDNLQEVTVYVQDTYWLNRVLTNSSHDVMIATLGNASWSIKNYSDSTPSTTTKFVAGHESGVLFYIYGINRISS